MNNYPFVRGSASRAAHEIRATLRDRAAAVQEINAELSEDRSAPAAPPPAAAAAEAPPVKPDHGQAMPAKQAVFGSPLPPVERKANPERSDITASPAPEQLRSPAGGPAHPVLPAGNAPAPLTLPALPDVTRQVEIFVAIATRNQETILRALQQVTALCARQQSQHEALVREVERVNARAVHLSLLQ